MNSRRLDSWSMLLEPPTFMTKDLPTLTFAISPKLRTKKPRVWVSGLLLHMPRTPRHCLLPSPNPKSAPLSNAFRRVRQLPSHMTRAMTLVIFVEGNDIGPTNVQTRLTSQGSLTQTLPSPMDALWDLQDFLDMEIHVGTMDTTKKDKESSKQNKQSWKNIPPISMESTKLVNGHTFHWCSKYMPPQWSTTHLMAVHTDYPTTSTQNTNAQLLDFDATTWVINLPIHNLSLTFTKSLLQAKASTPWPAF